MQQDVTMFESVIGIVDSGVTIVVLLYVLWKLEQLTAYLIEQHSEMLDKLLERVITMSSVIQNGQNGEE